MFPLAVTFSAAAVTYLLWGVSPAICVVVVSALTAGVLTLFAHAAQMLPEWAMHRIDMIYDVPPIRHAAKLAAMRAAEKTAPAPVVVQKVVEATTPVIPTPAPVETQNDNQAQPALAQPVDVQKTADAPAATTEAPGPVDAAVTDKTETKEEAPVQESATQDVASMPAWVTNMATELGVEVICAPAVCPLLAVYDSEVQTEVRDDLAYLMMKTECRRFEILELENGELRFESRPLA